MSSEINRLVEFGDFAIDLRKGLLLDRGQPIPIPPKAYETLIALVESGGRIVGKDEVMTRVGGATFVEENNLTQQTSLLSKLPRETGPEHHPREARAADQLRDHVHRGVRSGGGGQEARGRGGARREDPAGRR